MSLIVGVFLFFASSAFMQKILDRCISLSSLPWDKALVGVLTAASCIFLIVLVVLFLIALLYWILVLFGRFLRGMHHYWTNGDFYIMDIY